MRRLSATTIITLSTAETRSDAGCTVIEWLPSPRKQRAAIAQIAVQAPEYRAHCHVNLDFPTSPLIKMAAIAATMTETTTAMTEVTSEFSTIAQWNANRQFIPHRTDTEVTATKTLVGMVSMVLK